MIELTLPRTEAPKWLFEGQRHSVGGAQASYMDERTKGRLFLSASGLVLFRESDSFRSLVNSWFSLRTKNIGDANGLPRQIGADIIESSRSGSKGYRKKPTSVARTSKLAPGFVLKTFDYTPRTLARAQFDGMSYLYRKFKETERYPWIRSAEQFALVCPSRKPATIIMEDVKGEPDDYLFQKNVGVGREIVDRAGAYGALLLNDLHPRNVLVHTPPDTTEAIWTVIDQPHVSPTHTGHLYVAAGNMASRLANIGIS